MSQNILVLSGRKQSGKSSANAFIHGLIMKELGILRNYRLNEDGKLVVNTAEKNGQGDWVEGEGILDVESPSRQFSVWATFNLWPYVKCYSFADHLKGIAINAFGLTQQQCYGTNEDKDTKTSILWKDMAKFMPPRTVKKLKDTGKINDNMTAREFLEEFGTRICRTLYNDCWVNACMNQVKQEGVPFAIITDGRFPNEVDTVHRHGGKSIRFKKNVYKSKNKAETSLDKYKNFTAEIDNSDMSMAEKNIELIGVLEEWGWLDSLAELKKDITE